MSNSTACKKKGKKGNARRKFDKEFKYMNDIMESLFVEVKIQKDKKLFIGVIYRPPQSSCIDDFLQATNELLQNRELINTNCIITGDFNINLLTSNHSSTNDFLEIMLSSTFLPLISRPTRITDHSATLIDNIFCNSQPLPRAGIVVTDISDHFLIFAHFEIIQPDINKEKKFRVSRNFTSENIQLLQEKLSSIDWSDVYNSKENVDDSFETFLYIFNDCLNSCVPLKKYRKYDYKRVPKLPWVSKSILRSINRKNNLYVSYISNPNDISRRRYRSYKNTLTTTLRLAKKRFYAEKLQIFKNDLKNTWKIINGALNKSKKSSAVTKLCVDGTVIEDSRSIADEFNTYFSQVGPKLARNIIPGKKSFKDFLDKQNDSSIFLTPTHKQELIEIVSNLNADKTPGYGITNRVVKNINSIADPLLHIFNMSLEFGQVPKKMKMAKVIPIFKKGDHLTASNYRPISLLTTFSKILERIVYNRTVAFLRKYSIICDNQFGFREKHNTTHAILTLIHKISISFDNSCHTVGLFLDFSKAFDTIDHQILLYKLSNYGIRGNALEWFRSYLNDRVQFVTVNESESSTRPVTCGVPQGSILGPLLFVLYVNDMKNSSDVLSFILFADDSNIFYTHHDPQSLVNTMNAEFKKVTNWIKANKLSLNLQKTNYMLFSHSLPHLPHQILLDNTEIKEVQTTKFLGLTIDNKLTWNSHINNVCKTVARNIGVINKLKKFLPITALTMLYCTIILPYLNYGILAWGNATQTRLNKVLLLQKKVMGAICNAPYRAHTDELFRQKRILKINDLYRFHLFQFMYQLDRNNIPNDLKKKFIKNNSLHAYNTRQLNDYHLPKSKTVFSSKTVFFTGPKNWNSLDKTIKEAATLNRFKSQVKKIMLNSYQ